MKNSLWEKNTFDNTIKNLNYISESAKEWICKNSGFKPWKLKKHNLQKMTPFKSILTIALHLSKTWNLPNYDVIKITLWSPIKKINSSISSSLFFQNRSWEYSIFNNIDINLKSMAEFTHPIGGENFRRILP